MNQVLLVRIGEISLKGKNRYLFENQLLENIRNALAGLPPRKIEKNYGRIYVELGEEGEEVIRRLTRVFGIHSVSPAYGVPLDMKAIKEEAARQLSQLEPTTFKVETTRPYKKFPKTSPEVSREVGGYVLAKVPGWKVDVHRPEVVLQVEIRQEGAFVYSQEFPGLGGLPVGCAGKAVLLISGGIDSPVAGWLIMKRGVQPVGLHFHSFPFTSERAKDKVVDLCRLLASYGRGFKLYVNHFTEIQKAIRQHCPEEFYVTIMRRMMFRIAERVALQEKALALVTGENLGQVASQTLESMVAINEVTKLPVLRPLVTMDKAEIIALAEKIGTYEISILPYEDCCTLFLPKHPATKPKLEKVRAAEAALDIEGLIEESLAKTEIIQI
ncbi:MAG TPA: tRNA 4-thiouridine(8) synthase ThiI [Clostridia bacterium]|nr:tRNA 4-thiouridine(8) synthase ThiI [Clostridia bacterium]